VTKTIPDLYLDLETCCVCGIPFGMPRWLDEQRREDGKSFFCPNGHDQIFSRSTKEELAEARRRLASLEEDLRVERMARKEAETENARQSKRSAAGVCPCCHRSFVQLARHMKTKHPEHGSG
jgi:hypothetical protein